MLIAIIAVDYIQHVLHYFYRFVGNLTLYRMVMPIGTPFLKEKINN